MKRSALEHGGWILVCDGRRAIFFENAGDRVFPKFVTRKTSEHADRPSHELGSDVPGTTFSGRDGRHSSIEPTDLHRVAERDFLKKVAQELSELVSEHAIRGVVVAAPARALGILRAEMSEGIRARIRAEIARDYLRMPVYEIEKSIAQAVSEHKG